jgi:hypothetical protein
MPPKMLNVYVKLKNIFSFDFEPSFKSVHNI